jgi:hypothetical protein
VPDHRVDVPGEVGREADRRGLPSVITRDEPVGALLDRLPRPGRERAGSAGDGVEESADELSVAAGHL